MRQAEEKAIGTIGSLAAGVETYAGSIFTEQGRTLAVTCRVTYNADATAGVTVKLYFVHPDLGRDTVPFASFVPTLTADATVQRTVLIDCPEGENLDVAVKNDDGTYAATAIQVGYSFMRWAE